MVSAKNRRSVADSGCGTGEQVNESEVRAELCRTFRTGKLLLEVGFGIETAKQCTKCTFHRPRAPSGDRVQITRSTYFADRELEGPRLGRPATVEGSHKTEWAIEIQQEPGITGPTGVSTRWVLGGTLFECGNRSFPGRKAELMDTPVARTQDRGVGAPVSNMRSARSSEYSGSRRSAIVAWLRMRIGCSSGVHWRTSSWCAECS